MQEIVQCLKDNKRFLIASHVRPDGDAIGSMLGLALALRSAGKEIEVISSDPTPRDYVNLPFAEKLLIQKEVASDYDVAVILECSDASRTGISGLERFFLVNIDHHASAKDYANLNWIDVSFGAVGQMVFRLIEAMGIAITPDIATNLYVALMTDTGSFQYENTTPVELNDAGRLVQLGAQPAKITEWIYHSFTRERVRLLGDVLSTMETDDSGRIAWVHMTHQMLQKAGATMSDTEGIINHLMSIRTVQIAAFFKQESENSCKLSLRSKGALDVSALAQSFNGGGHKNAAGFTVHAGFEETRRQVLEQLQKLVNHQPG